MSSDEDGPGTNLAHHSDSQTLCLFPTNVSGGTSHAWRPMAYLENRMNQYNRSPGLLVLWVVVEHSDDVLLVADNAHHCEGNRNGLLPR